MAGFQLTLHGRIWVTPEVFFAGEVSRADVAAAPADCLAVAERQAEGLLARYAGEKHHAPWIRERQEQAEADVRRTWARDPVVLMQEKADLAETNDTQLIHEKQRLAN